jgi:hypothetical protein
MVMGIDTRFWGPSGWDLFHRIAFHSQNPTVLKYIAEVLPCRFCRNSTRRFVKELPFDSKHPAEWLFKIHNKVNNKLRRQCSKDPNVVNPGPDPSFEEVTEKYKLKPLNEKVGKDFLLSIAVNFEKTHRRTEVQKKFLKLLGESYPLFKDFLESNPPDFNNYSEWMNKFTNISIEKVESYKSKCKTGRTCRKQKGGRRRLTHRN